MGRGAVRAGGGRADGRREADARRRTVADERVGGAGAWRASTGRAGMRMAGRTAGRTAGRRRRVSDAWPRMLGCASCALAPVAADGAAALPDLVPPNLCVGSDLGRMSGLARWAAGNHRSRVSPIKGQRSFGILQAPLSREASSTRTWTRQQSRRAACARPGSVSLPSRESKEPVLL